MEWKNEDEGRVGEQEKLGVDGREVAIDGAGMVCRREWDSRREGVRVGAGVRRVAGDGLGGVLRQLRRLRWPSWPSWRVVVLGRVRWVRWVRWDGVVWVGLQVVVSV